MEEGGGGSSKFFLNVIPSFPIYLSLIYILYWGLINY